MITGQDPDGLDEHDEEESVRGQSADRFGAVFGGEFEGLLVAEPHQAKDHKAQDLWDSVFGNKCV